MTDISRLRRFVSGMTDLADQSDGDEHAMVGGTKFLLTDLISKDDWLPDEYAVEDDTYRQYLLHCDPHQRFSIVSFVWGPGQTTPIHDHTVWGLGTLVPGQTDLLQPGDVDIVSPALGDIHKVSNAHDDKTSISIHVYGANIGAVGRHVYDPDTGAQKSFISGYSNTTVPNLWDLSGG
ncbi:MAG: cysteine dioxygenase [Alphaproteobacteria bacterium]|nr:cysteine dioxygenase [Alphaproteobacteria bacterium]